MRRKFEAFDPDVINREFRALPHEDKLTLTFAMENYQQDTGVAYKIKSYGDGLKMITDSGHGQGRCLFFRSELITNPHSGEQRERLVALLVYKKESQNVPEAILRSARHRMENTK